MNVMYFVYEWTNSIGKRYIGYHKGQLNDGYISSSGSEQFWKDWKDPAILWKREIIQTFDNAKDAISLERKLLRKHKDEILNGTIFYNNSINAGILFTEEVRNKISQKAKLRPSGSKGVKYDRMCCIKCKSEIAVTIFEQHYQSKKCLGIPYYIPSDRQRVVTQAHRDKLSAALTGKIKSDETRRKMSESQAGRVHSEMTKDKIRQKLTGSNNPAHNTKWINDGSTNKRIPKDNNVPDGWFNGRIKFYPK